MAATRGGRLFRAVCAGGAGCLVTRRDSSVQLRREATKQNQASKSLALPIQYSNCDLSGRCSMDGNVEETLKEVGRTIRGQARKFVTGSEETPLRLHLAEELKKPVRVKLKDKLSFTLGIINILITEYFLLSECRRWIGRSVHHASFK